MRSVDRRLSLKVFAILAGCGAATYPRFAAANSEVERDVLKAFVEYLLKPMGSRSEALAFTSRTTSYSQMLFGPSMKPADIASLVPRMNPVVAERFVRANAQTAPVDLPVPEGHAAPPKVLDADKVRRFFQGSHGWERFHARYPKVRTIVDISRVGLDEAAGQALIWWSMSSGMLAGGTGFCLIERHPSGWIVVENKILSVS